LIDGKEASLGPVATPISTLKIQGLGGRDVGLDQPFNFATSASRQLVAGLTEAMARRGRGVTAVGAVAAAVS